MTELVPLGNGMPAHHELEALAALSELAATASSAEEAREIMAKASAASELLKQFRASREFVREAAKAYVLAARRLGRLLGDISNDGRIEPGRGFVRKSKRAEVMEEMGISRTSGAQLVRLARPECDPEFQRYIQDLGIIPSVNGALLACSVSAPRVHGPRRDWRSYRRAKANLKKVKNPTVDKAYSNLVLALSNVADVPRLSGSSQYARDLSDAMDHMYAAEDLLKKYRAGYDGTGKKAA